MAISRKTRFEILKRDKFTCQYCGRKAPDVELEVDHMQSRHAEGCDRKDNLIAACFDCNRGKGRTPLVASNIGSYIDGVPLEEYILYYAAKLDMTIDQFLSYVVTKELPNGERTQ